MPATPHVATPPPNPQIEGQRADMARKEAEKSALSKLDKIKSDQASPKTLHPMQHQAPHRPWREGACPKWPGGQSPNQALTCMQMARAAALAKEAEEADLRGQLIEYNLDAVDAVITALNQSLATGALAAAS